MTYTQHMTHRRAVADSIRTARRAALNMTSPAARAAALAACRAALAQTVEA